MHLGASPNAVQGKMEPTIGLLVKDDPSNPLSFFFVYIYLLERILEQNVLGSALTRISIPLLCYFLIKIRFCDLSDIFICASALAGFRIGPGPTIFVTTRFKRHTIGWKSLQIIQVQSKYRNPLGKQANIHYHTQGLVSYFFLKLNGTWSPMAWCLDYFESMQEADDFGFVQICNTPISLNKRTIIFLKRIRINVIVIIILLCNKSYF